MMNLVFRKNFNIDPETRPYFKKNLNVLRPNSYSHVSELDLSFVSLCYQQFES